MAVRIRPWLYESLTQLQSLGISRLISLGAPPAASALPGGGECLAVHLLDDADADLLTQLPACVDVAARAARDGATLLVACHAGVSRSAAVATASLMVAESLSCDAALTAVQAAHPGAAPNDGFLTQLQMFGTMRCRLDDSHAPYRRFRVAQAARAHAAGSAPDALHAASLLGADPAAGGGAAVPAAAGAVRCRKCRRLLATAEHTVPHTRGAGAGAFDAHKRRKGAIDPAAPCSSVFLEPLAWMAPALSDAAVEGKLSCPKCSGRLGSFSWVGERCSCGAWVVPAFQLHAARVDVTPGQALA